MGPQEKELTPAKIKICTDIHYYLLCSPSKTINGDKF